VSKIVSRLFTLIMLVASIPGFAATKTADGTVLINQAAVLDAGGFPFVITTPGNYKLAGNLVVPAAVDGIQVKSSDVTVDLNGFSITGPIVCDNQGITCTPEPTRETAGVNAVLGVVGNVSAVTVRNGHVRGFSRGVTSFGGLIEEITAESNFIDGIDGFDVVIRRSDASRNHGAGIACGNCVVTENLANSNHGNGFIMVFGGVFRSNSTSNSFDADIDNSVTSQQSNSCDGHVC